MTDFVTEQAKAYGLDLTTAKLGADRVWRANSCAPLNGGHWEYTADRGWVHFDAAE